ncbi:TatD family hydrolase [soil metagenome]
MHLIDTHIHLYAEEYDLDRKVLIEQAVEAGVSRFLMPNIDTTSEDGLHLLAKEYPGVCIPMMGLHPCYVKENYKDELENVYRHLKIGNYCAIGEIGMDKYWSIDFIIQQEEALRQQLIWSHELNLPVALHTRNATEEVVNLIQDLNLKGLKGVFHCFSGDLNQAEQITGMGFHLGIGGVLTFKNSGLDKVVEKIAIQHLVLETDGPYLAPAPYRGKRNDPAYIKLVAEKMAQIKNISLEEVAETTTKNAKELFAL